MCTVVYTAHVHLLIKQFPLVWRITSFYLILSLVPLPCFASTLQGFAHFHEISFTKVRFPWHPAWKDETNTQGVVKHVSS
jgi:hypothetical protein